jgi:regulator of cell morphogenesis and NO signaling
MQILERSIAELVNEAPLRARIFEEYAIDYTCNSKLSLAEACKKNNLDPETVINSLSKIQLLSHDPFVPILLGALSDEIIAKHHTYVREQGPRIQTLLEKVGRVHGEKEPRFLELKIIFEHMHLDLMLHMLKEENVLFPYCKQLEQTKEVISMHCGSVAMPIQVMESDHAQARAQSAEIEKLTDQFSPPDWACNSVKVLYSELKAYIEDLDVHMHLENNLLFPAALRREDQLNTQVKKEPA